MGRGVGRAHAHRSARHCGYGECDAVVGGSVVIGFPQVDLADGGAAGNDVGREGTW